MVSYGKVGMIGCRVLGGALDGGCVVSGGGGGGASLVGGGGGGGAWVCVTVAGARVTVCVTGGGASGAGDSGGGGGAADVAGGACVVVVVTVVVAGDGVLSLLRSTNHTATAIAARTAIKPAINNPTGRRPAASCASVSGSANCICGRGPPTASVSATPW